MQRITLNPEIGIENDRKIEIQNRIKGLIRDEFNKAENQLIEFRKFLQIQWDFNHIDFDLFMNKNLAKPGTTFNAVFNFLNY